MFRRNAGVLQGRFRVNTRAENVSEAALATKPSSGSDRKSSMASSIRKVGVIGAGQMGNGIAHVCALAGYAVMLNDLAPERIKSALATINGNMARQVSRKLISEDDRKAAL